MSATYCLGDFAQRLQKLPATEWKTAVESMPETCDRCTVNCRQVCAEYARMQWKMAGRRVRVAA